MRVDLGAVRHACQGAKTGLNWYATLALCMGSAGKYLDSFIGLPSTTRQTFKFRSIGKSHCSSHECLYCEQTQDSKSLKLKFEPNLPDKVKRDKTHVTSLHVAPLMAPLQDAPYLLEPLSESFPAEDPSVRLALLTAATQLFFKRPPECQRLLGATLAAGMADGHQVCGLRACVSVCLSATLTQHDVSPRSVCYGSACAYIWQWQALAGFLQAYHA